MIRDFFLRIRARRWARRLCNLAAKGDLVGASVMITRAFNPAMSAEQARRCGQMAVGVLSMEAEDARVVLADLMAGDVEGAMGRVERLAYVEGGEG